MRILFMVIPFLLFAAGASADVTITDTQTNLAESITDAEELGGAILSTGAIFVGIRWLKGLLMG